MNRREKEPLIRTISRNMTKRKTKLDIGEIKLIQKLAEKRFSIGQIHTQFPHVSKQTVWRATKRNMKNA